MPIAKTTERKPQESVKHKQTDTPFIEGEQVHPEVYKYFNLTPETAGEEMDLIGEWVGSHKNISTGLRKLRAIERKLGAPDLNESRIPKIYNWLRLSNEIKITKKQRDEEITSVHQSKKQQLQKLREQKKPTLQRLNEQISKVKLELHNATRHFRTHANNKTKAIKDKYEKQLSQLKELRGAYK